MNILGIGIVSACGRGLPALEQTLLSPWTPPAPVQVPFQDQPFPAYSVPADAAVDKTLLAGMRRADRFSRLAVLAAADALQPARDAFPDPARIGIILSSALGPHVTTFRVLDDILQFGDPGVSPTTFSHSVHNAAVSYISSTLGIRGPTITLTAFAGAFQQALRLAAAWLREKRCDAVLAGAVDECGTVMQYACSRKLRVPADGTIRPLAFSAEPAMVPGEGSVFLLLSDRANPEAICGIQSDGAPAPRHALCIVDANGATDESAYLPFLPENTPLAAYSPLSGSILTQSAFHVAIGALSVRNQTRYASPVPDNPRNLRVCAATERIPIESVYCLGLDCYNRALSLTITGRGL